MDKEKYKKLTKLEKGESNEFEKLQHFVYRGLNCVLVRSRFMATIYGIENLDEGCYLGYAEVPVNHPYFGKDYSRLEEENILVHGGITFSGGLQQLMSAGLSEEIANRFYLGFDCCHGFDLFYFDKGKPINVTEKWTNPVRLNPQTTTKEYCEQQTKLLADQILKKESDTYARTI